MTFNNQFLKYLIAGGSAAAAHLLVLWAGVEYLGANEVVASYVGFCSAIVVNYSLQHSFVYNKNGSHRFYFMRYFKATLVMQLVNVLLFWLLITYVNIAYVVAQILVIGVIFMCNYVINTNYTFKEH